MANYLDKDGLLYFWQKIKNIFAQKTEIPTKTSDLTNDSNFVADASYVHTDSNYTSAEKTKLSGIAAGAEVNQNAFSNVKVGSTTIAADGKTDTLELVAGSNVTLTPDATNDKVTIAGAYSDATTSASGLMSSSDKTKLNGIAAGAEVNVQADWNVTDTTSDAFIKNKPTIPSGVVVDDALSSTSVNPVQNKVINSALNGKVDTVSGKGLSTNDYTTTEKNKLSGIAAGAEVNQNAFSNVKVGSSTVAADAKTDTLELVAGSNVTLTPDTSNDKITIAATDTTYSDATQSTHGLMSTSDKTKLDGFSAASNYALKSDISGMYKFKGSVATESLLPSSGQTTGDVYNIEAASSYGGPGMNVAWDGSAWDALGEIFTITSVTNAEIDTIVAS